MIDRHFLNKYTPYRFVREYDSEGRIVGIKTIFHKSFLRNYNQVYDSKKNSYEKIPK